MGCYDRTSWEPGLCLHQYTSVAISMSFNDLICLWTFCSHYKPLYWMGIHRCSQYRLAFHGDVPVLSLVVLQVVLGVTRH